MTICARFSFQLHCLTRSSTRFNIFAYNSYINYVNNYLQLPCGAKAVVEDFFHVDDCTSLFCPIPAMRVTVCFVYFFHLLTI